MILLLLLVEVCLKSGKNENLEFLQNKLMKFFSNYSFQNYQSDKYLRENILNLVVEKTKIEENNEDEHIHFYFYILKNDQDFETESNHHQQQNEMKTFTISELPNKKYNKLYEKYVFE